MPRRNTRLQFRSVACGFLFAVLAPASLVAQRHGGGSHSGGSHSRGAGTGVPCGGSYISASKTCHVGTADVPGAAAASADSGAPGFTARPLAAGRTAVSYEDVLASIDASARKRCTADSVAAAVDRHPRLPECLRSTAEIADSVDAHSTLQDQRRYAAASVRLLAEPSPTANVVAVVPRHGAITISSCMVGPGAWCLASFDGHTGYTPRGAVTGDGTVTIPATASARRTSRRHGNTSRHAVAHSAAGVGGTRHPGYYLGPRGGCYTYSASGRKRYVSHSYCG